MLASAVYFVALGNSGIWDANEAFYVETPREMLEANDLVNPTFNYVPRFNKPVLSYWIVAGFYKAFGISVGVQRFAIAIGALVLIASAYLLASIGAQEGSRQLEAGTGKLETGDRQPATGNWQPETGNRQPATGNWKPETGNWQREAALWAAVGLAAAPRLVMFARRIFIDIWTSAFLALTLVFFALSEARPERRRRYLALMYASIGLGVLTKGPVAIALPALAFGVYLIVRRELRRVTEMMIPLGIVIVAAIVVPWYAALYREHGWTHIQSFLVAENVERFTQGLGVRQERGPWFYLPVVLSDSFPWSLLLFAAAVAVWRQRSRLETLLWCWIASIVGFFSLSAGKQDLYIFPIVPAVAALGGLAIQRGLTRPEWTRWLAGTLSAIGVLLVVAGGAVLFLFQTAGRTYALDSAALVGVLALAGGLVAVVLAMQRRPAAAGLTLLGAIVAMNWAFVVRVLPEFERYKPVPAFSETLQPRLAPDDVVAHYQVALPSMVFYLRRHVEQFFDEAPFVAAIHSGKRVYAILSADDYAALGPRIGGTTCVIERRPTFEVKLRQVLSRQPLPELLLITNRCGEL